MSSHDTRHVIAERASRAIAEAYTDWGPGPLPWAIAERFVSGALLAVIAQERRIVAAYLRHEADARRVGIGAMSAQALEDAADRIERGEVSW